IGNILWIATADARIFPSVVEWSAGVLKHLAYLRAASNQVVPSRLDVVHREGEALHRARLGRRHSFPENDRGLRVVRCELNDAKVVVLYEIDVEPPAAVFIKRL